MSQAVKKAQSLEEILKKEREINAETIANLEASHKEQMEEQKSALEDFAKQKELVYRQNERSIQMKQQTLLTQLQKEMSIEQEAQMQSRMESMQKSAKESILRQRMEFDAETKAEEAAKRKFDSLVESLKTQWAEEEAERTRQAEERVRASFGSEIVDLKAQLEEMRAMGEAAHTKWSNTIKDMNEKHVKGLKLFAARAKKVYDERLLDITKRMEDGFNRYEQELLEQDKDMSEQTMLFENRLHGMKMACNKWKEDYKASIDQKHGEMAIQLENKYMIEIEKLLSQVSELQEFARESKRAQPESSRVRMDGLLANVIKMRKALQMNSDEVISLLMKLLQNSDFSPRLLSIYSKLECKTADQLPLKRMATRREFVKYRLAVMRRFGDGPSQLIEGKESLEDLEDELEAVTVNLWKELQRYERDHDTVFVYEGRPYREVLIGGGGGGGGVGGIDVSVSLT